MEKSKRNLIMISQTYPFGFGEAFLEREIEFFSREFNKVVIYPSNKIENLRTLPAGVELNEFIINRDKKIKWSYYFKKVFLIWSILSKEFIHSNSKWYILKNAKKLTSTLIIQEKLLEDILSKQQNFFGKATNYYAVWMDEAAILLALLKRRKLIDNYVVRLHGYDLYDERREGGYMPFRYFCFKYASQIFVVSKAGETYLKQKNIFPEKIRVNYSGVHDLGLNPTNNSEEFVLLSCSFLADIKRVDKISEILALLPHKIHWIHVGDGPEKNKVIERAKLMPANIRFEMRGMLNHNELMNLYKSTPIDLFIHLSETEGLPMSLVEAMSFGIPVLATNAGGTSEIVNDKNGVLIDVDFKIELVRASLKKIILEKDYRESMSREARNHFLTNFQAQVNYTNFINQF